MYLEALQSVLDGVKQFMDTLGGQWLKKEGLARGTPATGREWLSMIALCSDEKEVVKRRKW